MRRVILYVRDLGRWRPVPADPGYRGHGLKVMRDCADELRIDRTALGTTVKMAGYGVPLLDKTGMITVPAVDHATAERRHRQAVLLRATEQLHTDARTLTAEAGAAWLRAQHTMQTSSRLRADAQRIRGRPDAADQAA